VSGRTRQQGDSERRAGCETRGLWDDASVVADLTPEERRSIARALRRPIGRYNAERAAQLSGVPSRTLYHWAKEGHLKPDFGDWEPKQWSYRDLVLARLFAWARSKAMPLATTEREMADLRRRLASRQLDPSHRLRATPIGIYPEGESVDHVTGSAAMPSVLEFLDTFDLLEPVDHSKAMWGPSLVHPSTWTAISPDVFAGEPIIRHTRTPTSALYALQEDRGLDVAEIVTLYPGLRPEQVADGLELERRIRRVAVAA
jgi:uncharacterized protein (DUF433 family)/DNA-binding transcriptional MerR regulator